MSVAHPSRRGWTRVLKQRALTWAGWAPSVCGMIWAAPQTMRRTADLSASDRSLAGSQTKVRRLLKARWGRLLSDSEIFSLGSCFLCFDLFIALVFSFLCPLTDTEQIRETLRKGLEFNSKAALPPISSQKQNPDRAQWVFLPHIRTLTRALRFPRDTSFMCGDSEPPLSYHHCFQDTSLSCWFVAIRFLFSLELAFSSRVGSMSGVVKQPVYIPSCWQKPWNIPTPFPPSYSFSMLSSGIFFHFNDFHLQFVFCVCFLFRSRKDSLESESSAAIVPHELVRTRQLESVHLKFNQESGTLLPLCLRYTTTHTYNSRFLIHIYILFFKTEQRLNSGGCGTKRRKYCGKIIDKISLLEMKKKLSESCSQPLIPTISQLVKHISFKINESQLFLMDIFRGEKCSVLLLCPTLKTRGKMHVELQVTLVSM